MDLIEKLKELAGLHQSGLHVKDEFAAVKAEALARMRPQAGHAMADPSAAVARDERPTRLSDDGEPVALKLPETGRGAQGTDLRRLREEAQRH